MGNWILGAVMAALSLFGLFLASRALDGAFHLFGLVLFLGGLAAIFTLIVRGTGEPPRHDDLGPAAP